MGVFDKNGVVGMPKPNYDYITTQDDAIKAVNEIYKYPIIEVDSETTAYSPYEGKVSLIQIGIPNKAFIFDVRNDTEHSSVDPLILKPILNGKEQIKLLQNAVFDMKMIKYHYGFYIENIYDTMLTEQLFYLGRRVKANLPALVFRYLGITMDKESSNTFKNYGQKFQKYQLEYAANDVSVLRLIRDLQLPRIKRHGFEDVCRLEYEFTKPMCEMELNGIVFDVERQRELLRETELEKVQYGDKVNSFLSTSEAQTTLFGVSLVNLDSNLQLKKALNRYGLELESTSVEVLGKYKGLPIIDALLGYRKAQKFISTYGETLISKINKVTGRLHTEFNQMVSTGRMSSSDPNLQNIPKKQKYRSSFISKPEYSLITADMSGAELRILGNMSRDPIFIECFKKGIDLHSRTIAEIKGIPIEKVTFEMRNAAKAINFGLIYGLSKYGLARQLKISEKKAEEMMNKYFERYRGIKKFLNKAAKDAVRNKYSMSISGRKRFYNLPDYHHPDYKTAARAVERQGMNQPIQGCLVYDTNVKGLGYISDYVDKKVELETGFGKNEARGVYSGEKEVYRLILNNGSELGITLEHKIPVCTFEGVFDKNISDIELNKDLLMIPLNVEDGNATDLSGYEYEKGHWRETYTDYPYPDKMNEELAFVVGCLVGDGNYSKHNYFKFMCDEKAKELFEKYNELIKKIFNYDPVIKPIKKKNSVLLTSQVSSVVLRGFLKHVGLNYIVNRNKSIPKYFFTETLKNKGALLNGLFSTDGGVTDQSGPNYTTTSKQLANDIQQLLFSLGINSNLKTYVEDGSFVYRLQIYKRYNKSFNKLIGFSVNRKTGLLDFNYRGDRSSFVPSFIPKTIYASLKNSGIYSKLSYNERANVRRFKKGSCSFYSWRKFYEYMPECEDKKYLSKFLNYDFCKVTALKRIGIRKVYDLCCVGFPNYFIANGVIVHNSNADTIKQSMIYLVNRLEESGHDAKLILTVHDEVVVETKTDQVYDVKPIVEQSLTDGFGRYFSLIPMETEGLVGDCWLKDSCENKQDKKHKCGGTEFRFDSTKKLRCIKCGGLV